MDGYVKLYRKSLNSRAFQNDKLWKVWTWCLMKASHKKMWVTIQTGRGDTEIEIQPGQFIFGRKKSSEELKMKSSSVRNRMEKLKNLQNIDMQPATHCTIVSVCNWIDYQLSESPSGQVCGQAKDNQRTTKGQPKDTYKNVKNVKNVKKEKEIDKEKEKKFPPSVSDVEKYCVDRKNGISAQQFVDFYEARGWMIGKNKMKNWQAAVRTWEARRKETQNEKYESSPYRSVN